MSQNNGIPKIESVLHSAVVINQPMVRDYSTGGGHGPEDTLVEGDQGIVTRKWQGHPPENLSVIGTPMPPMPEVSIPRLLGKAEYAVRVHFPDMLQARFLTSPHPRSRIRSMDTTRAERMPGVAHVLTYRNAPTNSPLPQDLDFFGEVVAIVAADTEDQAEDAVAAIEVDYEVLPFAANLDQVMAPDAPDLLRGGRGNLTQMNQDSPHYDAEATWNAQHGDIDQGFAEAEVIREFTYYFAGATNIPMQPFSSVARWEGDQLTMWGMGQSIYPKRRALASGLGIDTSQVRYINKYNGCTFGPGNTSSRFDPAIAHIARMTGRPVKMMLPKDQELGLITIKPEIRANFRVGAMRDGKIVALDHDVYSAGGAADRTGLASSANAMHNHALYTSLVPHWKETHYNYKTNNIRYGCVRSCTQQEVKWGWENMIDEMAEALDMDPVQFRLMNVARPGVRLNADWGEQWYGRRYELENGEVHFDSFASVEVLEEGARAIGWDQRSPVPGGNPGRFKRGIGVGMSQHHPGHMGYHDGEIGFEKVLAENPNETVFGAALELTADGVVTMRNALPDSGTNHDTALAQVVAEILGFTTRDQIRVLWGDSDVAPETGGWVAGKTVTVQGAAIYSAADKLRTGLLYNAALSLGVDEATLEMRDGVISSTEDPQKRTTFAELARASGGVIRHEGRGVDLQPGRGLARGVGTCFFEVEVDTWTGNFRFLKSVYCHDTGKVVNPLVGEADMLGSLAQSSQMTLETLPSDREFPGTRHYSVGYLSYRLPTIMDVPDEQTNIFINSLEPRWFYGIKSFSETTIGGVPGAISNAIYNACGVRIREHPVTRDKILAGLKEQEETA